MMAVKRGWMLQTEMREGFTHSNGDGLDFSVWQRQEGHESRGAGALSLSPESLRILGITPFERPDLSLARAFCRQGAAIAIDLGRDSQRWPEIFSFLAKTNGHVNRTAQPIHAGLRVPDHVALRPEDVQTTSALPAFVVLTAERDLKPWLSLCPVLVQVTSLDEAESALEQGANGLIAKGQESGGLVGEESSFILTQRLARLAKARRVPLWTQGGIGLHTSAAAIAGGAFGVVVDSALSLLAESSLPEDIKNDIRAMDGSETRLLGGYSLYSRPGLTVSEYDTLPAAQVRSLMTEQGEHRALPVGQDAALAKPLAAQCSSVEALLNTLRLGVAGHLNQAVKLDVLGENSPLAQAHGTRYPIAQGPMTRVSDTAAFAAAVAENGALPFLALSLMREDEARKLLEETRDAVGNRSWGVGVLGFASPDVLKPHLDLIQAFKPSAVLLAGGRPSQARALVEQGIPAYLHVPSPGLLSLFLKDGAQHFVFEGRECGGHVGPRFSFVLWEQQMQILLGYERPETLHLLFAGGIHDDRSAAMVAAMTAPLAARGAKIGVLMGSAYITTHEAVRCGAVNENFQKKIVAGGETVLLETAPGHATRCLRSGFVEQFHAEKQRLQADGKDQQAIWSALENLNVGRLRIATKGLRREGDSLVDADAQVQETEGMYMIGQVAALCHEAQPMARLHESVSRGSAQALKDCALPVLPRHAQAEPVAIVGMACIYPGSPDLESYWANIVEGRNLVSEVPADRWNVDIYYQAGVASPGKTPSKWGGFIEDQPFDPLRYGIPPQSLAAIEPVQLLSLEVASRALADAGYDESGRAFDREKTSVIFGAESGMDLSNAYVFRNSYAQYLGEMPPELDAVLPDLTEDSFPGVLVNVISGRIANRLGLGGVNYSVDAACASSLTAIEVAVKELRSGGSDMVLAGGADFHNSINDFLMFASVKALSPTGSCRSFDDSADGICLGEGVGVVVLKRLSDAERDGDRIYAVIDGIAGSSDGKGLGLTAPRKEGQKRALERAYWQAGVLPGSVGLVEAHGTGTVVGDRTELQTLTEIFNAGGALPLSAGLGSVKSQIGHTKCAAGIAGFIKIAKALYHRVLPPTIGIEKPNAGYDPAHSPFKLNATAMPWPQAQARAAVSAFGFGGTNFHAVLSAWQPAGEPTVQSPSGVLRWPAELFLFHGENFETAARRMQQFARFLRESDALPALRDLAWTICSESTGAVQCAIIARDVRDLLFKLECAHLREKQEGVHYRQHEMQGKLAFVFPGQGSQSPGMLQDIFVAFPALQSVLQEGSDWLNPMFPPTPYQREAQQAQQRAITDTRVAQPTLGMADYAMATMLQSLGIRPDMLAGHSYGELVALAVAQGYDLPTLLKLSEQRGKAILAAAGEDPGRMAAVSAGREALEPLFSPESGVVLANQNSPSQTVISGSTPAIESALARLKEHGIAARPIEVACAFHSPIVAQAEQTFAQCLDAETLQPLSKTVTVYSNVTARPYPGEVAAIKPLLASQIVNPVRFVEQIEQMYADGARIFVEVGPGRVLSGLIQKILSGRPHHVIATDQKGQPGLPTLLEALGQLAVLLSKLDTAPLWAGRAVKRIDLEKPARLPSTSWMINGARARPRQGDLPRHAGRSLLKPLALTSTVALPGAQEPVDQAVFSYLNNMRDLVAAQRDVMLGLLGATGSSPLAQRAVQTCVPVPRPTALPAAPAPTSDAAIENAANTATLNVRDTLLAIVSERTGYPVDMLDPELDLEADLSIDSIKRIEIMGELAERIGLRRQLGDQADALLEQLAGQKTLHAMTAWLHDRLPAAGSAAAPRVATGREAATSSSPSSTVRLDARQVLLSIVSQRTGYPEDVLDLDLDLEADLSIDSIKRLEIVGELSDRLGLQSLLKDKDSALETLAALKTLRAIVDWLKLNTGTEGAEGTEGVSQDGGLETTLPEVAQIERTERAKRIEGQENNSHENRRGGVAFSADTTNASVPPLTRYVLRHRDAPQAVAGSVAFSGKHFLITDDGLGVAVSLAARLEARGASVRIIDFSEHAAWPEGLADVDGLVHLFGLSAIARVRDVKRFFELVRETLLHKLSCLLVASGLGGNFGHFSDKEADAPEDFGHGAGVAGMLKTVTKEWPEVKVHCVDLNTDEAVEDLAAYLEIELLAENPLAEVAWQKGNRHQVEVVPATLPVSGGQARIELDRNSVVLLTGGARGITAKLAIELARRFACQLELIGRSPLPKEVDEAEDRAAADPKTLRQFLIQNHPEWKPAEVEKQAARLIAVREIRQTLSAIEAAGGRVNYTAMDVRDIDAFTLFIEDLYRRHGRLDGVIHGAGVVEDKLLRHKTPESFQRVFDTKVRGALMLYKLVRDDIRFIVFFSSVAGAFGNKGQVDYATANDVLDKIAHALQGRINGRVLSVNWGPWAGAGMVSAELEREYARKGIGLIPLGEGVDALLRELQYGVKADTQVVFMCATPENMGMAS